jgi:hypothetical protein
MKQMDAAGFNQSLKVLTSSAGRRYALRSLSAAGMALLVGRGLANGGDARNRTSKHQDAGKGQQQGDAHADGKGKGNGKGKRGPTGPAGPTGPTGPANGGTGNQGPTGPTGPAGRAPSSVIRFGPEKRETGIFLGSVADCQPGEHAVGGGHEVNFFDNQSIDFLASNPRPLTDGAVPTSWVVDVNVVAPGGDKSVRAFVICVPD